MEPTAVICGHTHAAREITLDGDRRYLNAGTWTDQIEPPRPEDPGELRRWIDELERGRVERRRRLTYVHVTRGSVRLRICRTSLETASSPVRRVARTVQAELAELLR